MHHVFHYHILHLVAEQAGFSKADAEIMAYSSALVDYSLIPFEVETPRGPRILPVTHHYGLDSNRYDRSVWVPFHFFPGDLELTRSARQDGLANPWIASPHSQPVKELLVAALHSRNLFRIGIALHTYADAWAHQHFSGLNEPSNQLLAKGTLMPPIGHAQAGSLPDGFGLEWQDTRLHKSTINNNDRFLEAAEYTYRYLCTYQKRPFADWPRLKKELLPLFERGPNPESVNNQPLESQRVGPAEDFICQRLGILYGIENFEPLAWLSQSLLPESQKTLSWVSGRLTQKVLAVTHFSPGLRATAQFDDSSIWQWCQAAAEHRQSAELILRAIGLQ